MEKLINLSCPISPPHTTCHYCKADRHTLDYGKGCQTGLERDQGNRNGKGYPMEFSFLHTLSYRKRIIGIWKHLLDPWFNPVCRREKKTPRQEATSASIPRAGMVMQKVELMGTDGREGRKEKDGDRVGIPNRQGGIFLCQFDIRRWLMLCLPSFVSMYVSMARFLSRKHRPNL